ncbi:glycosyltransferase [Parabacteroides timonensis]|uniref:glycosyltransferase n=1 Tax=Parabacteroides timonensis TaxID=1871013 RepID=UPI00094E307F|nr:glycosyltransferase [Parabacteroides timonensis]
MRHVYIFDSSARATNYGIGTYIKQLVDALKYTRYNITIVNIIHKDVEFEILNKGPIRYILIPAPVINKNNLNFEEFEKSIPFILYPYVDKNENNIFHLNYMGARTMVEYIRSIIGGSIVLTVHYTEWSFSLLGNRRKLFHILKSDKGELDDKSRSIYEKIIKEKDMLNICDKIIAVSKHSYNDLIKIYKINKNKISIINNALNDFYCEDEIKKTIIKKRMHINKDDILLLFVGRLDPIKGIDIMIKIFKIILDRYSNLHLLIVGEGDFNKCLLNSFDIWTKVSFTGFLSKKNLFDLYTISDIGIVPSLHEEFGYVAVEMMSFKIPIIVNDTTGLSEIVDDRINGFKVSVNSQKKTWGNLIEKICFLIENPDLRKELGDKARNKFETCYNLRLFKDRILELYDSL